MWPFSRKPLLHPDLAEWMFDHAEWLLSAHSRASRFARAQLVPISDKFFPQNGLQGHDLAEHLLERTLDHMGFPELRIRLIEDARSGRFEDTGNRYAPQARSTPAGTYTYDEGHEISYDTTLLRQPAELVAVFAHEVSHAVLDMGASFPPPSDEEFDELLTDFTAVFLGFGLFQIAFRKPSNPGSAEIADEWRNLYAYYMNRKEGCFATALFAAVHDIAPDMVLRAADIDCRGELRRAFRDLEAHRPRVAKIRQALIRAKARG